MKKNIMFILPSLCGGGAEKTVANLSKKLIEDFNVYIIVFRDTKIKYSYEGKLVFLPQRKDDKIFSKVMFTINAISFLKKFKRDNKIDYAISFLTTADMLNVLSKSKNTKNYISIRNTDSLNNHNLLYLSTHISTHLCDHIISISKQVKEDLVNNFKVKEDKITTIYNPAQRVEFGNNMSIMYKGFFDNICIVNAGRLTYQKGQWHLIRAFSKVVSKFPNAKLMILGEGELREYLLKVIRNFGLENNVKLLGFVNNPYDYIKNADCFVFSSLYEGLGNSILEALTCGTPIISTDCVAGPREILSPRTDFRKKVKDRIDYSEYGILVPVPDGKQYINEKNLTLEENIIADAIIKICDDNKLRENYKEKSLKRSKDFYIDSIIKEWKRILN